LEVPVVKNAKTGKKKQQTTNNKKGKKPWIADIFYLVLN